MIIYNDKYFQPTQPEEPGKTAEEVQQEECMEDQMYDAIWNSIYAEGGEVAGGNKAVEKCVEIAKDWASIVSAGKDEEIKDLMLIKENVVAERNQYREAFEKQIEEIERLKAAIIRADDLTFNIAFDGKLSKKQELGKEIEQKDARIKELEDGLREIAKGKGRYSSDKFTHAVNTIDDMKALAKQLLNPFHK